jgi:glycosyltransferase involved in cell wall biosynthesis
MPESDRKLKVLMVGPGNLAIPPRDYGGIENYIENLASAIRSLGHDVTISNRVPSWRSAYARQFVSALWLSQNRSLSSFDVVHVNSPLSAIALFVRGVTFVYSPASRVWLGAGGFLERIRHIPDLFAVRHSPALIALNILARDLFENHAATLALPILVAPVGFDSRLYTPQEHPSGRERLVVDLSAVIPQKRIDINARACEIAGLSYLHMGPIVDSRLAARIRRRYPATSLSGPIRRDEVISNLRRACVFLHSSDMELQSAAAVEAMGCGLPVIGSEALADVVTEGKTGFIVSRFQSDESRARRTGSILTRLLEDEGLRRSMSTSARAYAVRVHDWGAVAKAVEGLYLQVAELTNDSKVNRGEALWVR